MQNLHTNMNAKIYFKLGIRINCGRKVKRY
jgi:hypothetical protein